MDGITFDLPTWAANNLPIVKPITFHDPKKNEAFWLAIHAALRAKRARFVTVDCGLEKAGLRQVKAAKYD